MKEFEEVFKEANLMVVVIVFVGGIVDVGVVVIVWLVVVACFKREALTNFVTNIGFEPVGIPIATMPWVDTNSNEEIDCYPKMNCNIDMGHVPYLFVESTIVIS